MNGPLIGSLCTGYGGLDGAVMEVLGGELAWVADNDPGAAKILAHHWPDVPNLGDITGLDWAKVGKVDILCAGFPCTDISDAGLGEGILEGNRSGLWYTIADAVGALRPGLVVLENVRRIITRRPGLEVVLGSLADLGFDAVWTCVRASDVGAPHERWRWFCLAWPADSERPRLEGAGLRGAAAERDLAVADAADLGHQRCGSAWGRRLGPADRGDAAAHADGGGRRIGQGEHRGVRTEERVSADIAWGKYEPAVRRWERILGRPVPAPAAIGAKGGSKLSPTFDEWMMGLPEGHVTDVPGLTDNQMIHACGNGVVRQQAAYALRILLDRARAEVAA